MEWQKNMTQNKLKKNLSIKTNQGWTQMTEPAVKGIKTTVIIIALIRKLSTEGQYQRNGKTSHRWGESILRHTCDESLLSKIFKEIIKLNNNKQLD